MSVPNKLPQLKGKIETFQDTFYLMISSIRTHIIG